jgi:uncharacterized protein YceK
MRKSVALGIAAMIMVLLSGCTTYYKISDPNSDKVFYTTNIDKMRSGTITFKDAKTKSEVTLPSSEVQEISSDEYDKAVGDD